MDFSFGNIQQKLFIWRICINTDYRGSMIKLLKKIGDLLRGRFNSPMPM